MNACPPEWLKVANILNNIQVLSANLKIIEIQLDNSIKESSTKEIEVGAKGVFQNLVCEYRDTAN